MGDSDGTARLKEEIRFFMEKSFQASFGYLTVLGVVVAASTTSYVASLAHAADVKTRVVVAGAILGLNLFYFIMIIACTFAVVKRGLFILKHSDVDLDREWEIFARSAPRKGSKALMPFRSWNIDNYFMVPIFVLLAGLSVFTAHVGLNASRGRAHDLLIGLIIGYAVPLVMAFYLILLNGSVKREIADQLERRDKERATADAAAQGPVAEAAPS